LVAVANGFLRVVYGHSVAQTYIYLYSSSYSWLSISVNNLLLIITFQTDKRAYQMKDEEREAKPLHSLPESLLIAFE